MNAMKRIILVVSLVVAVVLVIHLARGQIRKRDKVLRHLVDIQYTRNDYELKRGTFRVRGDTLEIMPAYGQQVYRVEFFGDEIDRITEVDALTGEVLTHTRMTSMPSRSARW